MRIAVLCDDKEQFKYFYNELLRETKHREQSIDYSDGKIKTDYDTYYRIITISDLRGIIFDTVIDRRVLSYKSICRFNMPCGEQINMCKLCKFKESE